MSASLQKPEKEHKKLAGFVAGVSSGITKAVVGHPYETIKIRLQTEGAHGRFRGLWDCVRATYTREGLRGFYKGLTPPLVGWMLMDAIMLGSLHNLKKFLGDMSGRKVQDLAYWQHALAGTGSGWCVCLIATPVEVLKAQLQVQYDASSTRYSGPIDCARSLIKNNGIMGGLYRGFGANLIYRGQFCILWSAYEFYSRLYRSFDFIPDSMVPFLSGGSAANTFWVVGFPSDVIKNRIMSQPDTKPLRYPSIRACFRTILETEGWRGFYRGFIPAMLRSFPTNAAAIGMFDLTMKLIA